MGQLALGVVSCIVISVLFGWFLDSRLNTGPWLVMIFALLGIVSAFKFMYDVSKRVQ